MSSMRNINIILDQDSWFNRGKTPSSTLLAIPSPRATNTDLALLHTALWTRPPRFTGFDLADCWAWLRYQRAFDPNSGLRLRREWEDIDPHQKTVLSDEVGVGYTTQLLVEEFGVRVFADTLYLVKMLPGYFYLAPSRKRGPSKSPDFIGLDQNLTFHILECKGTQSSLDELRKAVGRGIEQKQNLVAAPGTYIGESLVAGLYIPRWDSADFATIMISDPTWEELLRFLKVVPQEQLLIATIALGMAKHFALMGLHTYANFFSSPQVFERDAKLPPLSDTEQRIVSMQEDSREYYNIALDLPPVSSFGSYPHDKRAFAHRVIFSMRYNYESLNRLYNSRDLKNWLLSQAYNLKNTFWISDIVEEGVLLSTPLGFEISLRYVY